MLAVLGLGIWLVLDSDTWWRKKLRSQIHRGSEYWTIRLMSVLRGGCWCGAVRYQVPDEFLYAWNCHCSRCRATTGSAFKPLAGIEREKLEIMEGADALFVVGDDALNDTRCASCGSFLFSVVRDGAYVHVGLGSLIDAPSIRPTAHIFVGSKATWFEITDELPQFEEYAG